MAPTSSTLDPSQKYEIEELPIFAAGTHDGVYYSIDDLEAMVGNHNASSESWMPAAGLGHYGDGARILSDSERRPIEQVGARRIPLVWPNLNKLACNMGTAEPAVGWITKLWRKGRELWAKVQDIPAPIAQMIKDKMFRWVSAEVYQSPPDGIPGANDGCFLHGIGFLGKQPPEVKTLGEVPSPTLQAFAGKQQGKPNVISILRPFPTVLKVHVFSQVPTAMANLLASFSSEVTDVLRSLTEDDQEKIFRALSLAHDRDREGARKGIPATNTSKGTPDMDLNQLAVDAGFSEDAIHVLGTLPPNDQAAIKKVLQDAVDADNPAAYAEDDQASWEEIGNTLRLGRDDLAGLQTFPPPTQDLLRNALTLYIDNGGAPVAFSQKAGKKRKGKAFSQKSGGNSLTTERRRELLEMSPYWSQKQISDLEQQDKRASAAAFSSRRSSESCMTPGRRTELLNMTGTGSNILKFERGC